MPHYAPLFVMLGLQLMLGRHRSCKAELDYSRFEYNSSDSDHHSEDDEVRSPLLSSLKHVYSFLVMCIGMQDIKTSSEPEEKKRKKPKKASKSGPSAVLAEISSQIQDYLDSKAAKAVFVHHKRNSNAELSVSIKRDSVSEKLFARASYVSFCSLHHFSYQACTCAFLESCWDSVYDAFPCSWLSCHHVLSRTVSCWSLQPWR